jgi:hypothetical protein
MKTPHHTALLSLLLGATALSLAGCSGDPKSDGGPGSSGADSDPGGETSETGETTPPLDVTVPLSEGEVRAGPVVSGAALFGGVSAEGREGDLKIYNSEVQFIVQGVREGDYYEAVGGGVIDADIVRPAGMPGRDIIDEFSAMVGFGRLVSPSAVEVIADGSDGQAAVIQVTGRGSPMALLVGALESDSIVPDLQVAVTTTYTLRPDSPALEIETTLQWEDIDTNLQSGDLLMAGMEAVDTVLPGRGLQGGELGGTGDWMGLVGRSNEVALAVFSDEAPFTASALTSILSELGPILAPFGPPTNLSSGDTLTHRRTLAVGPDLASLTAHWNAQRGVSTTTVGGTVTAGGAPVAGARVHLLDGENLETIAFTDASGAWTAEVRATAPVAVATGRGHGEWLDLPAGSGWVAPYAHPEVAAQVLDTLENGAEAVPFAEGYGVSEPVAATADTALELGQPGTLSVTIADGGPAVVRVDFASGDPVSVDRARVPGRPGGAAIVGYVADGALDIPVEPGDYLVTVHRGLTHEAVQQAVSITSGEATALSAELPLVVAPAGMLALDPHSHASPSGDGEIPMSHRLLTMAANGVQVHFGTDHDHVADYRPLLAPLGIDGWLTSVVANEASPVLRGHTNVYPVEPEPGVPNAGAPRWWNGVDDTEHWYSMIREWAGPEAIIQVNHPTESSGMFNAAAYSLTDGMVRKPDFFASDFQAMEVLNDGEHEDYMPYYLDLVGRGYEVLPIGVSDSHGYRNGAGLNLTWLPLGIDTPSALTNAVLIEGLQAGGTIASRGPFLDVRVGGAWAPGATFTGAQTLEVTVHGPSHVVIDELVLLENGVEVDRVASGEGASFTLDPAQDAHYVVIATGSTPMQPVSSLTPWAMSQAVKIDVGGDGWTAPLPALGMAD